MKNKNHVVYGLVGALVLIVLFMVQYFAKISSQNPVMRWVPMLVLVGVVIAGCINYSKINDADVTFGEVFGNGFKITAIITVITCVFYGIFVSLFPDFKERAIEEAMANAPGNMNQEQMEQGMEFTRKNFTIMMVAGALLMNLLTGVIASLVGAAVAKKRKA
ncbi:DUF4199 domain-containing protein [Chitinophaga alhagiae]|uniref:DUF4199 domain-containing protein n=1 Tax=Chitinophaga alhagiae TaxID=2203219 RepID=UPI000E5AADF2|nr:DUF4199 domain-containing protein [Chitinophaga alhagiae]